MTVSYNAQKKCRRLTDYIKKKEEDENGEETKS